MSSETSECPVDHTAWKSDGPLAQQPLASTTGCPVDHTKVPDHGNGGEGLPPLADVPSSLSKEREVSSIPRAGGKGNWEYPSQQQFYSAMKRKSHDPQARDMPVVIPIHNAVNERAWQEILRWEKGWGADKCGGPQLARFSGDASKISPKARWNMLVSGAVKPFDRHDWVVDRCGTQIEYIIDFYSGSPDRADPSRPSFYLDVRPKLNSIEGIKMRVSSFLGLS